ncbi:MAG: hypothetical protein K0B02_03525 [DPANN group archaeon]|nr:hypothetical protein [DPANN group archaeon]
MKIKTDKYEEAFDKLIAYNIDSVSQEIINKHYNKISTFWTKTNKDKSPHFDFKSNLKTDWDYIDILWDGAPQHSQFINTKMSQDIILTNAFETLTVDNVVAFIYDPAQLDEIEKPIFPFTDTKKVIRNALSDDFYKDIIKDMHNKYGPITISRDVVRLYDEDTGTIKLKNIYTLKDEDYKIIFDENPFTDLLTELTTTNSAANSSVMIQSLFYMMCVGGYILYSTSTNMGDVPYMEELTKISKGLAGVVTGGIAGVILYSTLFGLENTKDIFKESYHRIKLKNKVKEKYL